MEENPSNKKNNRPKTILKMRSLLIEENETLKTDESNGSKIQIPNHDTLNFPKLNRLKTKSQDNKFDLTEEKEIINLTKNQDRKSGNLSPTLQNERKLSNNGTNSNHSSQQIPSSSIKEGKTSKKVLKFADELLLHKHGHQSPSVDHLE